MKVQKPYPNYHAARIRSAGLFVRIRVLKTLDNGIMLYGGPLKSDPDGPTKIQTIRFPKKSFTVKEAKAWLKEHNYSPVLFEPASKSALTISCIDEVSVLELTNGNLLKIREFLDSLWENEFDGGISDKVTFSNTDVIKCHYLISGELANRKVEGIGKTCIDEVEFEEDEDNLLEKARWTRAYINDLPDSAFFYIESGGKKDDENKTVPRSLRHFPYKDKQGNIDLPHVRNAIARAPQSKLPKTVIERVQAKARKILEDANKVVKGMTVVIKNEDERVVCGIVYEPDEVDSQGDTSSAEEIRKAAYYYMEKHQKCKVNHKGRVIKAAVLESYLAPDDFIISGRAIKKGTWLMTIRVNDDKVWELVKSGDLQGFSMAGYCEGELLDD